MKKVLALILALVMIFALAACGGSGAANNNGGEEPAPTAEPGSELAGTYDITVWVADAIVDLTKQQIEDFNANNTLGITFNATVEAVGEGDAATQMITDVEAGGDIFCFAQDQFARLVQAGALAKLGVQAADAVRAANDPGVVAAATAGDELFAYPLTSDNGYFMYYDKSVIPEEDVGSLEKLIADCEAAGKYFSMENETSAWYIASWFFGTGCVSEWETDSEGTFISLNDTFNSDKGLIAAKGMKKLLDSQYYLSASDGAGFDAGCAVVVTGTWAYETVSGILGENLGAAPLPSFEVDGQTYHMGSFNGCKLMGVKPQTDAKKAAALHQLAQYLTGEQGQMERFNAVAWGPANLVDQADPAVQSNVALAALFEQNKYSVPQGQIHGSWWDIAKVIGTDVKEAKDEDGLKQALQNYYDSISAVFNLDTNALLFVGAWNGWNNADESDTFYFVDNGDGTASLTLEVPESDYMGGRIVTPGDWGSDKGFAQVTTGADLIKDLGDDNPDNNIVFAAAGTYTVTIDTASNEITIVAG